MIARVHENAGWITWGVADGIFAVFYFDGAFVSDEAVHAFAVVA